ncbi:MAG: hypothetical protein ACPGTU_17455 [Myxococcota bacterium]
MIALFFFLCAGCTSSEEPDYARTSGPMGVTDNGQASASESEDSGDTDTGDTGQ